MANITLICHSGFHWKKGLFPYGGSIHNSNSENTPDFKHMSKIGFGKLLGICLPKPIKIKCQQASKK